MPRLTKKDNNSYTLHNFFGFDEEEIDFSLLDNTTRMNDTTAPVEFQQSKPYRLALYVRPSEHRKLQKTNASLLVKNTLEKLDKSRRNESGISKLGGRSEGSKNKKRERKVEIMLFDENTKPEPVSKIFKKTPEKLPQEKLDKTADISSARKNILKEVNTKPVTKTKQSKIRKSYERKCKQYEPEKIVEPPSDVIMKELDIKKISRTKQKKTAKEDQEFEKWANNMNSAFSDVDKFELSITYD